VLDADELITDAENAASSSDWGETPVRDALEMLCRSARDDRLEEPRVRALKSKVEQRLVQRLQVAKDRRAYPEIAQQEIKAPLVVTGLPRGGTTILHGVLSRDPWVRSPLRWELDEPSPPPRAEHMHDDPRLLAARERIAKVDPALMALHTMAADLPEEDQMIFELVARSHNLGVFGTMPTYLEWLVFEADMRPAYEFHRQVLQHYQAFAPKAYWVLKTPLHLHWLDDLFATYPDARVVVAHRDPAQTVPSHADYTTWYRSRLGPVDPFDAGRELFQEWGAAVDRLVDYRARHPRPDQFIDVNHVDFHRAPMAVIEAIYDKFAIELTDEARSAMAAFMDDNRTGKHGGHTYTAEAAGLSKAQIRERFKRYIETYDVPLAD